jgi:(2Fe-2S) ferredoxin
MTYDFHVFVCTNERKGSERQSCGESHGMDLVAEFKKQLKDLKLDLKLRANKSGCLGICDFGPTVVIYPQGTFYVGVQKEDVRELITSHILNNTPLERLRLKRNG